jgi:hypothetical protein
MADSQACQRVIEDLRYIDVEREAAHESHE